MVLSGTKIFFNFELNVCDFLSVYFLISVFAPDIFLTSVWDLFFDLYAFFLLSFSFFLELSTCKVDGTVTSETFFVPS